MGALLALISLAFAGNLAGSDLTARYDGPTTRYAHGVLGDDVEYGELVVAPNSGPAKRFVLPDARVFEDLHPRVVDLDGDGQSEVITIESDARMGARLAIWGPEGRITEGPFIGTRFRWLAPVAAADFDSDGYVEIAYVDRPHLAKTLTVFRYRDQSLEPVATLPGVTNHRIGEDFISGGLRDCSGGPEMILASGDWSRIVAVTLDADGELSTRDLGPFNGRASLDAARACSG